MSAVKPHPEKRIMHGMTQPPWLDEQQPHDPEYSQAQIDALRAMFEGEPRRVLDLGCGTGRVLVPLARDGHQCVGVDLDSFTIKGCRDRLEDIDANAELIQADFLNEWPNRIESSSFDAVMCLGNTFMTITDVEAAIELVRRARNVIKQDGVVLLDDIPGDFWPELTEGNWQSGVSPEGDMQIVWDEADSVFTLRQGESVDTESWRFKEDDRLFRLWTTSQLRLVARLAGLSALERRPDVGLVLLRTS